MQAFKGQCFKVDLEELVERLDVEFYEPNVSFNLKKILGINNVPLGDLVVFSKETWDGKEFHSGETFPYIEISSISIIDGLIKKVRQKSTKKPPSRAKMIAREGDIMISTTRPHRGAIANVDKAYDCNIASTGFAIIRTISPLINKGFLYHVLRSEVVLKQMKQRATGGNYPAITIEELNKILIPVPSLKIQEKIVELLDKAYELKTKKEIEAKALLDSVDDCLFGELGIKVFKESGQLNLSKGKGIYTSKQDFIVFKTDLNRIKTNLDVRYFLPKYDENIKEIRKAKFQSVLLQEVAMACNRGKTPTYVDEGEIGVVKVNSIQNGEIKKLGQFVSKNFFEANEQAQVKAGAVLITATGEGSIGKIALYKNETPALLDNHVCKLSVNASKCLPEYVCAFLNTARGTLQIEQAITGSTGQTELYAKDILNIIIPIPPLSEQERITHEIERIYNKAYEARQKANKFLEQAKKQAEELIFNKK